METYYQRNKKSRLKYQNNYNKIHKGKINDNSRKYREDNLEKVSEYQKKYRAKKSEHLKEYYYKWYKLNGRNRADNYVEKTLEWREKNPEKSIIQRKTMQYLKENKIARPKRCPRCNEKRRVHAHHYNYESHLNYEWLCSSCHKKEHYKNK